MTREEHKAQRLAELNRWIEESRRRVQRPEEVKSHWLGAVLIISAFFYGGLAFALLWRCAA